MNIDFTLLLVLLLFAAFIVQTVINWRLVMLIAFGAERFIKHDVTKREIGVDKIHARVGAETQRRQQDELAALLNPDQENLPRPPIDASAIAMGKGKETY